MEWSQRLLLLLESATRPDSHSLPEEPTRQIKSLLRGHSPAIECAFEFLSQRIKFPDPHVRFLVVEMVNHLFLRSKEFRKHVANQLQDFLRYSVGFDNEYPLPGCPRQANKLRDHALQVVQKWNRVYGHHYRQIGIGYNYLKGFLNFQFPEAEGGIRQEESARQRRAMQILKIKYSKIVEIHEEVFQETCSVSQQLIECITLIEDQEARSTPWCSSDVNKMELEWEEDSWSSHKDPSMKNTVLCDTNQTEFESAGLRSYACYSNIDNMVEGSSKSQNQPRNILRVLDEAVVIVLRDLARIAFKRLLPTLQAWIRTLTQVDVDELDSLECSRRQRLLSSCINEKGKLQDVKTRLTSLGVEQEALYCFKASKNDNFQKEVSRTENNKSKKRKNKRKRDARLGLSKKTSRVIIDPTAPKTGSPFFLDAVSDPPRPSSTSSYRSHQNASESLVCLSKKHQGSSSVCSVQKSKLPKAVLDSLLSKAPIVEGGSLEHFDTMESHLQPMQRSGFEFYNHWGRVDDTAMLPPELVAKYAGQEASFYQPPSGSMSHRVSPSVGASTTVRATRGYDKSDVSGVERCSRLPMNAAERKAAIREEDKRHMSEVARLTNGNAGWEGTTHQARTTTRKNAKVEKLKKLLLKR